LKRALLVFNEQTERPQTRKILIVCSDFKDSFQELPSIPSDVEIITIGVLPDDNSVEKKLHTEKIEKFENVNSAIQYIFSTF
jgi:nitric oxide reductase activation protein